MINVNVNKDTIQGGSEFEGDVETLLCELTIIAAWLLCSASDNKEEFEANKKRLIGYIDYSTYDDAMDFEE